MTNEEVSDWLYRIRSNAEVFMSEAQNAKAKEAVATAINALETVERFKARKRELEKKMHSSFSLIEANEHYALTKLLREAENEDRD